LGSAPDPAEGAYSAFYGAPRGFSLDLRGPTSKWRGRKGDKREGMGDVKGHGR